MKILSIETTSQLGSIAICKNGEIKGEIVFRCEDIAEKIVKTLDFLMKQNDMEISGIDYVVISKGPGSWTGIRVGMGFAKGLVKGEKERIYCVSVPESLFFVIKDFKKPAVCVVNAYREEFYISFFNGKFLFRKSFNIRRVKRKKLEEFLKKEKYFVVGPGILELKGVVSEDLILPSCFWFPRASFSALLVEEKLKRKIPSLLPEPYYGR